VDGGGNTPPPTPKEMPLPFITLSTERAVATRDTLSAALTRIKALFAGADYEQPFLWGARVDALPQLRALAQATEFVVLRLAALQIALAQAQTVDDKFRQMYAI